MSRLHFGGHRLRIARHRLLREYSLQGRYPECGRCGQVIDPTLSGLHPDGATVGHIVPVSRGGDDSYENTQLEHRRCNLHAGARVAPAVATVVEPVRERCLLCGFPNGAHDVTCASVHLVSTRNVTPING